MIRRSGKILFPQAVLHYKEYGKGSDVMLCFHGFAQSIDFLKPWEDALEDKFKIFSFDLFFHGKSIWDRGDEVLHKEEFTMALMNFLKERKIKSFSLMGFSMGARFALVLCEKFPAMVEQIFLLAPDGISKSLWYRLATFSIFSRKLFKEIVHSPVLLKMLGQLLVLAGGDVKAMARFAEWHLATIKQRDRVYRSWMTFRKIQINPKNLGVLVNKNRIEVFFFLGRYDRIITYSNIKKFVEITPSAKVFFLSCGHSYLIREAANYIQKHPNILYFANNER